MAKEVNLDAFADRIAEKLLAAKQQANDAGQNVGEEFIEGVVKGIKEHSKDVKSEMARLFEDFNKTTNNFKSRKSISNSEWTRVLGMSRELLKSERYANAVQDKLNGIAVTFNGIGKVSGLTKVLKELEKAGDKLESVQWSEAGKNYKKKSTINKTRTKKPTTVSDPKPAIDAEKQKQKEVVKTTEEIKKQTEAQQKSNAIQKEADVASKQTGRKKSGVDAATGAIKKQGDEIAKTTKKMLNMESAVKRYNKLMNSIGREHLTIGEKLSEDTDGWNLRDMVSEAQFQRDYFYSQENRPYDSDELKEWISEKKKLERFINTYKEYITDLKTTQNHSSDWDNTPKIEKQTQAVREQEEAAEKAAQTVNQQNKISISSYQELYEALKKVVELSKQLKQEDTAEFEGMQKVMDKVGYPSSKESLIASIKAQYGNVQRIKSSIKNGLSVYNDVSGDGYEYTRSIDSSTLSDAEDMLRAYIYKAVEYFGYTVTDVMNDFSQKRVRTFVEKTINQYLTASAKNDEFSADANAFNAPIKEVIDSITSTIYGMVTDVKNLNDVSDSLSELKYRAEDVNRYTLSSQANSIGSKIGINTPYDEIQLNAKKIESYEELCEVVARYNALQENAVIFGGNDRPGLNEDEEIERQQLRARLEATGGKDIYKLSGFYGFDNVEKLANVLGIEVPKAIAKAEVAQAEFTAETEDTAAAQNKLKESVKDTSNLLYHAGDLSNPSQTQKTYPLGHVSPSKSYGVFNGFTGLYTTEDVDGFWGNEWHGAPISTIDASQYKLFDARTDELATKAKEFFDSLNGTIYGYIEDFSTGEIKKITDVKSVDELWANFQEVFKNTNITFEQFSDFVKKAQGLVNGKNFDFIEGLPDLDEGVRKTGEESVLKGVSKEIFNSDSFQTQLLKMLGYEGIDLRGTKHNGTYTGGTVIFDVKPESIKTVNEKWSDVMGRHGYEIDEADLTREEKRRQLAFDTAKAYSQQADAAKETKGLTDVANTTNNELQDTFDIIQKGENITGKFATTANTVREALQKMRDALPEEQKEWSTYIDGLLTQYDEKSSMDGNIAVSGSMGNRSEQYRVENLGNGRLEVTFSGIRDEAQATAVAIQKLEEHVNNLGDEFKQSEHYRDNFNILVDGIKSGSVTAAQAMDRMSDAYEEWNNSLVGTSSDVLKDTLNIHVDRSNPLVASAFKGTGIKDWIKSMVQPASRGELEDELYKLAQTMADGDVEAYKQQMSYIADFIIENYKAREQKEADIYEDLFKNLVVTYSDEDVAAMGPQLFEKAKATLGRRLQKRTEKNKHFGGLDQLVHSIAQDYPWIFKDPDGSESEYNKLDELLDTYGNWKQGSKRKTVDRTLSSSDKQGIIDSFNESIMPRMYQNMVDSAAQLREEQIGFDGVANSAERAANGKKKFTKANQQVGQSADDSAEKIEGEADALKAVTASAEELPDGDVITKFFDGDNEDPSAAAIKKIRTIGNTMQTEIQKFQANEDGEWDIIGSSVTEKKIRGMQDYVSAYSKEAKKLNGIEANIRTLGDSGIGSGLSVEVDKYTSALKEMDRTIKILQANPDDVVASQQFDDAALQAQRARTEIDNIFKASQKLKNIGELKVVGPDDVSKIEDLRGAMIAFANSTWNGEAKINGFNKEGTKMYVTLNQGAGAVENITVALDDATGRLNAFSTGTSRATNEWNNLKKQATDGVKRLATMYLGFNDIVRYGRQGLNYVKEIDLAMTELKKVTDETDATYKEFLQDAGKTASVIGSTISDFTNASSMFARLGYDLEESASMAETAIIYKNVADGLDSVEESSESIISTMMAFGIEANDTMSIIDRFNAVGNNFAITSAGIGEALQRSASALFAAGNTLDESVALVTAANSVIQNPEQVGTALKTLSLRLRGAKTELEEAGEDVEGMAENTSELQAKLKALTHGKVDIMLDADTFKSTTQILREMSAAWEDMTDIERASALELMGGKRQSNILSSVITNFETVEDVIETSMNSSGSAMAENEKWLDSIEGKTYQFTNALQTMWSNLLDSEMIKGFLDFGTKAIEFFDTGTGKAIAFVSAYRLLSKAKGFSLKGLVQGLQQSLSQINTASQALNALTTADTVNGVFNPSNITAYAAAVSQLTPKMQAQALAAKGLSNEQIRQALTLNGVDKANMKVAMSQLRVTQSTQQSVAVTGQEAAAILAAQNVKLSDAATNFLQAHSTEEVTEEMLKQAVTAGTLTTAEATQIAVSLGLTGANHGLAASFKAVGHAIAFMFKSNPVGFIISIVTTILSLIPIFNMFGDEVERTTEEIVQSLESAVGKCNEIANELRQLKESADDVIPRFAELSEGVDNFGNNISLTDEEYKEFLDLNNKIAEMFPEINIGFDENGNAMLALAGSAEYLIERLNELTKAEMDAANQEIADKMPGLLDDLEEYDDDIDEDIKDLESKINYLRGGYYSFTYDGSNYQRKEKERQDTKSLLDSFGINYTEDSDISLNADGSMNLTIKEIKFDPNSPEVQNAIAVYENQINNLLDDASNRWKSLNSVVAAWMKTDWDFSQLEYDLQNVALMLSSNLDFSELGLTTEEDVQNHIREKILTPLNNASPEVKKAFAYLFEINTSDYASTSEYINTIKSQIQKIADVDLDDTFTFEGLLKDTGYGDIIKQYETTAKNILEILDDNIPQYYEQYEEGTRAHFNSLEQYSAEVDLLKDKIYSLSPDEVTKSFDIIKKYGIKTWDELQEALENKTFDVVLNYDKEQEGMEKLLAAIEESMSATGLSSESIANIKARYQDLENYDPSRLFEDTANGISLNTSALRELEQAYKEYNKEALDNKLDGLVETYNDLTAEIESCVDASERAALYAQRQNVLNQINDTATLAAQYTGLTSAYKEWQDAQSGSNERDMYEGVLSGRKEMDEEMSRGWIDEGTRQYLELLSGKDLSKAAYDEVLEVYKAMNKAVNSSGFNVYDFFTTDEDGNSTNAGIFNFLDAVKVAQEELGENWVKVNEKGEYIFDFGEGGDKAVAQALGISEELVQIILRAARDAGFEVNLDTAYSQLADFKNEVDVVNDKLKSLGVTDYTFNINSTNLYDIEKQIEEAEKALKNFYNEDGTIRTDIDVDTKDVENAKTLLATLIYQKQTLDDAVILKVDTQNATSGVQGVVKKMIDFKAAYNEFEVKTAVGADTTEAETAMNNLISSFTDEDKRILCGMGLDLDAPDQLKSQIEALSDDDKQTLIDLGINLDATPEDIIAQINALDPENKAKVIGLGINIDTTPEEFMRQINNITPEVLVSVGLDATLIEGYQAADHNAQGTVTWENNTKAVTDWIEQNHTATGTVEWGNDATKVKTHFTATGTIDWSGGGTSVNGTAHSSGTAYSGGSWGAQKTETSLVGELGPEILVRNGRWTTVGENGAEFTQVKKGDIIFNHKQTESLLKNGYVTGRGKAHASGTAFSDGTGPGRYTVTSAYIAGGGADRLEDAAESVSDAADEFKEVFDWIEVRLEEINDDIDLRSAQLENKVGYKDQNKTVDKIIDLNQKLYDNLIAGSNKYYAYANKLLTKVPEEYRKAAQDGTIAIETFVGEADEKTLEAIKEYREWVQKGDEAAQRAEETLTEISNLARQAIENIAQDYDNKRSLRDNKMDQYEAYNEFLETDQGFESASIYQAMINENNRIISGLEKQRDKMQEELNKRVESGEIKKYSQDWYDAVNDIAAVDTEIIELKTDTENYQDTINELHWDKFDDLLDRIESVSDEADNLIDILGNEDMVDESGNWTDEGITALGLHAQRMEAAEVKAQKLAEEISYLDKNWQKLGYTESEYLDKRDELKDQQYEAIQTYHDEKDAIVDLNKERIDAIKKGIEKEVEAYEELIEVKKEELDAEKDLYDFQKTVADKQKNIADIRRKLAAIAGDTSASARARRAQLEAELAEAEADLQETYYDRSISDQQDALDKELENFQETKDKEMEGWDEYLENTNQVVADSLATVQANTETVYNTLLAMGEEYSLSITESLTAPWQEGENAIQSFSEKFGVSMSATVDELTKLELEFKETMLEIEQAGIDAVDTVAENAQRYTEAEYQEPKDQEQEDKEQKTEETNNGKPSLEVGSHVDVKSGTKWYSNSNGGGKSGMARSGKIKYINSKGSHPYNIEGLGWIKKSDIVGYAKGSTSVDKDQWALIDELGDELQLVPGKNGRLEYIKKGTGIIPSDMTERLMNMAMDPQMMIEQNRPKVGVSPSVINNTTEINIDSSVGELIHVEHLDGSNAAEITKIVDKAWDKRMKELNAHIRRYANR